SPVFYYFSNFIKTILAILSKLLDSSMHQIYTTEKSSLSVGYFSWRRHTMMQMQSATESSDPMMCRTALA
ncbi:MAG TPA: hypothetical protein PLQ90_07605, partial [Sphaerochaeta sp.]|nr:hypothetical protein [Sphaerochaeta sp.]